MQELSQIKLNFQIDTATRLDNVSDEDYFGPKYKKYISNSLLKLINPDEGGSPTRYYTGFKDNSHSPALELGTAVHQMILEKEKYYVNEIEKPSGKVGIIMDTYFSLLLEGVEDEQALQDACDQHDYYKGRLTQHRLDKLRDAGAEYIEHLHNANDCTGCITLTIEQKEKLDGCLASVKANKLIVDLLNPSCLTFNEDVITMKVLASMTSPDPNEFEDTVVELDMKAKIDNWSVDVENKILTLNDLKTTGGSISAFGGTAFEVASLTGEVYVKKLEGSFQKFRYYRQMAMYAYMLQSYCEKEYGFDHTWTFNVNMLVVETNKPYLSHAFSISEPWLMKGEYEMSELIKRIAYHTVYGWDSFTNMSLKEITVI